MRGGGRPLALQRQGCTTVSVFRKLGHLKRRAEHGLYRSKQGGRDRVIVV
jgi:hypothetical protein